jgi:hypothetical protein
MTSYFETITQYDNKYNNLLIGSFNKSSCSMFSILIAYNFLENPYNNDKLQHEKCIDNGIVNYLYSGYNDMITFDEMLQFTNLDNKKIMGTTIDMILTNVVGFNDIIPNEYTKPYCIIFLHLLTFKMPIHNGKAVSLKRRHRNGKPFGLYGIE